MKKNHYRRVYKSILRKYGVDKAFVYSYIYDRYMKYKDFYFTRYDIASFCNISIKSVSRYLKDFESNGDFSFSRGDTIKVQQSRIVKKGYYEINNELFLSTNKELIIFIKFLIYLLNKKKDKEIDSSRISKNTGIHNRMILDYLKELESFGFIKKIRTKKGFLLECNNNRYMILFDDLIKSQLDESDISLLNNLIKNKVNDNQKIIVFMLQCYILGGYFDIKTGPKNGLVDQFLSNILASDPGTENAVYPGQKMQSSGTENAFYKSYKMNIRSVYKISISSLLIVNIHRAGGSMQNQKLLKNMDENVITKSPITCDNENCPRGNNMQSDFYEKMNLRKSASKQNNNSSSQPGGGFLDLSKNNSVPAGRRAAVQMRAEYKNLIDTWNESVEIRKITSRTHKKILVHFKDLTNGRFFSNKEWAPWFVNQVGQEKFQDEYDKNKKYGIFEIERVIKELAYFTRGGFEPVDKRKLKNFETMMYDSYNHSSYFVSAMLNGAKKVGESAKKSGDKLVALFQEIFIKNARLSANQNEKQFEKFAKELVNYTIDAFNYQGDIDKEEKISQISGAYAKFLVANNKSRASFINIGNKSKLLSYFHHKVSGIGDIAYYNDVNDHVLDKDNLDGFDPMKNI